MARAFYLLYVQITTQVADIGAARVDNGAVAANAGDGDSAYVVEPGIAVYAAIDADLARYIAHFGVAIDVSGDFQPVQTAGVQIAGDGVEARAALAALDMGVA